MTWSSSNAASCTASGGWTGTRSTSGSEQVGPLTSAQTYTLTCDGAGGSSVAMTTVAVVQPVTVNWTAPTQNTDGSPLTDLASYVLVYGTSSSNYTTTVPVGDGSATSTTLNLAPGVYYVAMRAVNAAGDQSTFSNEVVLTVQ